MQSLTQILRQDGRVRAAWEGVLAHAPPQLHSCRPAGASVAHARAGSHPGAGEARPEVTPGARPRLKPLQQRIRVGRGPRNLWSAPFGQIGKLRPREGTGCSRSHSRQLHAESDRA